MSFADDGAPSAVSDLMPLALSEGQADIWFAQQLAPHNPFYNIGGYLELPGTLDLETLTEAIQAAVAELDSLHFRFIETDSGPHQVRAPAQPFTVPCIDCTSEPDPRAGALTWMQAEMARPFDCAVGPLFRFALLKIAADRVVLFTATHHLVTDFLGTAVVPRHILLCYDARINSKLRAPAELPTWAAVLSELAEYRDSARCARDRAYWLERLSRHPPPLTLSGRLPTRGAAALFASASIPRDTINQLETLAAAHQTSLVAVFAAAAGIYLARLTGRADVVVGLPMSARTNATLRASTGFLANTVPLRLQVESAATVLDILQQTGRRVREALRHQRYPHRVLRNDLGLGHNGPSLFGMQVNFLPTDFGLEFNGRRLRCNPFVNTGMMEDLCLNVLAHAEGDFELHVHANAANYDASSLRQHVSAFVRLLESMVTQAGEPVRLLPWLRSAEPLQLSHQGIAKTFVELFESTAKQQPGTVAVALDGRDCGYSELNARANRLAHRLIKRAVGPGSRVAVWADRSLEMSVAVLGIMKAGGAYMPLDPAAPAERLRAWLEDARPMLWLSRVGASEWDAGVAHLPLDESDEYEGWESSNPTQALRVEQVAGVIYPSGVEISHGSLSALATAPLATFLRDVAVTEALLAAALRWRGDRDEPVREPKSQEPPQTPTETRLADIWRDVLRVSQPLHRHDDFFDLGGHSLLALQVVARVRDAFHMELPLKTIFEAATLNAMAASIDAALAAGALRSVPPIVAMKSAAPAPLSYSQERMWLIQALDPANTAYNMGGAIWLRGELDVAAFAWSLDQVLVRHEILRSRIRLADDQPQQIVIPWTGGHLDCVDLRNQADPQAAALSRAVADLRATFDLSDEPVFRVHLLQTAADTYLLSIVLHHIAADQWSMGVVGRDLAALYNQRRRGSGTALEPLSLTYRDYAHWQRGEAFSAQLAQQLAFWKKQLEALPAVDLPIDGARPKVWTMRGAFYQRKIPDELFDKLGKLARAGGSTLFMTLFAGFAALLHRLSGQTDLPVGVPVANRTHSGLERLVGTFVNTLVLRSDLRGDPTFTELLTRVRATVLDAFANQDVSFDHLVREIGQRSDLSRAPLVQVLFNVANAPMHGIELDGVEWKPAPLDRGGAQFELSFNVDTEVTRDLSVEYNTDLFEHASIERLVDQYLTLLESAADAPRQRLSQLALLPAAQLASLRVWNDTRTVIPAGTFPELFTERVARNANRPAVTFEGQTLKYGELEERADSLAGAMVAAGLTRGDRVAVCVRRSSWLLVSLLAAMKSGGAYVPLDPDFPSQRLQYMLADSAARILLISGELPRGVDIPEGVTVIDVEQPTPATQTQPPTVLAGPRPQDVAYVLYTSGSTGQPKGVAVSHGALLNFLCSMRERPGLTANDILAAVTTISFDIAGLELYLPLLVGARIELLSRATASDGTALATALETSGATVLQATPATWRLLLEAGWRGSKHLRALCGGEGLPRKLADELLDRVGELWNLYGPTETTIWSTVDRVERDFPISIGRPIHNTVVHILDCHGARVPIGVVGEICIGGAGVAEGYYERPELTRERFIADAYADAPGQRLYRTGDLGRWGPDGRLYHLGRSDHQVKVRGFRIELGEVEKVLGSHPAVAQAVAIVREARADDPRLVAYVVYGDGEDVTVTDMKRYLRGQLPDYMIPSLIVPVMSLPLTPNGKIDRAALPDPFATQLRGCVQRNPPATAMERALADIWKSVLQVQQIDALDNFFELGGYSLLSLRVVRLLEKHTGRSLDPRMLFFHNLRELAGTLEPAGIAANTTSR